MPALRQAWYTFRGLPSMMRGKGMRGIRRQVWKFVTDSKRTTVDKVARKLTVPKEYAAPICEALSKDGHLIRCAGEQGYAAAAEEENEVLKLAEMLKLFSDGDISTRLEIAPERAAKTCQSLHRHIVPVAGRKYVLRKDLDAARVAIAGDKGTGSKKLAVDLGITASHAKSLCECLVEEGSVLKRPQGQYVAPKKQILRLVGLVNTQRCVGKAAIANLLGLGRHYADSLCARAVADGYLRMSPDGEYVYPSE